MKRRLNNLQLLPLIVAAVIGVVGAICGTWFLRGSFGHVVIILIAGIYIALPALVLAIASAMLKRFWRPTAMSWLRNVALGVVFATGLFTLSYVPGRLVNAYDVAQAKSYCEELTIELNERKQMTGEYPTSIAMMPENDKPAPRLLRGSDFYSSDGKTYSFSFVDPAGMLNGYAYESKTGRWTEWD